MPNSDPHLTDRTLIQLADGELLKREASAARSHLDACWQCRARLGELEATISEFIQVRAQDFRPDNAPGPRALFRARLAETAAEPVMNSARAVLWRVLPAAAAVVLAVMAVLVISSGTVSAEGPKPKSSLTPGETRPVSLGQICGASETQVESDRLIPMETRRLVFAAYGMDPAQSDSYEVDYLITPELGGAATVRNLWPQPYSARWNARVKDVLEHRLHQLVCEGKVDLAKAQHDIATDWIGAYRKYVGTVTVP